MRQLPRRFPQKWRNYQGIDRAWMRYCEWVRQAIDALCDEKRGTAEQLAIHLECEPGTISNVRSGKRTMDLKAFFLACDFFRMSPIDMLLLGRRITEPDYSEREPSPVSMVEARNLLEAIWRNGKRPDRDRVLSILRAFTDV